MNEKPDFAVHGPDHGIDPSVIQQACNLADREIAQGNVPVVSETFGHKFTVMGATVDSAAGREKMNDPHVRKAYLDARRGVMAFLFTFFPEAAGPLYYPFKSNPSDGK